MLEHTTEVGQESEFGYPEQNTDGSAESNALQDRQGNAESMSTPQQDSAESVSMPQQDSAESASTPQQDSAKSASTPQQDDAESMSMPQQDDPVMIIDNHVDIHSQPESLLLYGNEDYDDNANRQFQQDAGCLDDSTNSAVAVPTLEPHLDLDELSALAHLEDIRRTMEFVQALRTASLDDGLSAMDVGTLQRMRDPPMSCVDTSNSDFQLGLDLFLANVNCSQDTYAANHKAVLRRHPDDQIPSYDQMRRRITKLTGIIPIVHDMCRNSCLAYTGPSFSKFDACPECGELRIDPISKKAVQRLFTLPIGPQLQVQWADPESAWNLAYRQNKTREIMVDFQRNNGQTSVFEDFLNGAEYLKSVILGCFGT